MQIRDSMGCFEMGSAAGIFIATPWTVTTLAHAHHPWSRYLRELGVRVPREPQGTYCALTVALTGDSRVDNETLISISMKSTVDAWVSLQ